MKLVINRAVCHPWHFVFISKMFVVSAKLDV
jgi:hypothetical protein